MNKRFEASAHFKDESVAYEGYLERAKEVKHWLESIDIKTDNTRIDRIIQNLVESKIYIDNLDNDTTETAYDLGKIYNNSIYEAQSLYVIKKGFENFHISKIFRKKLKDILNGPERSVNEDSQTNHARNILFELEIAAHILQMEYNVVDLDDVNFTNDKYYFTIECKRPFKKKSVPNNIKYAFNKLRGNLIKDNNKGFVAISFEKIYTLDKFFNLKDDEALYSFTKNLVEDFINCFRENWQKYLKTNYLGMLFYIKTSIYIEDTSTFKNYNALIYLPFKDINKLSRTHPEKIIYLDFTNRLKKIMLF